MQKQKGNPTLLCEAHQRKTRGQFAYGSDSNKCTLLALKAKKNKVVMLSTLHTSGDVDASLKKPEIIDFYNSTKRGVDVVKEESG